MLVCFFDIDRIISKEFVSPGQTVNVKFCCDILRWLRELMRQKWSGKWCRNSWVLHHNNVPVHTALSVLQFLASENMTVVPHPPYLPDLAPP
jgi:histone-lysine N-methyltransferase SETMAR